MPWEDLIAPEQVEAARGYGTVPPRPPGPPTYGLTVSRKVVPLAGLTRSKWLKDPIEQVTSSGWSRWYPTNQADFNEVVARAEVERNATKKTRRKPRGFLPEDDVADDDEPPRNRHLWN